MFGEQHSWRYLCGAVMLVGLMAGSATAQSASDQLAKAIQFFDDGQYEKAQELLVSLDQGALTDAQRKERDAYADRVAVAVNQSKKAKQDLDDADRFYRENTLAKAGQKYQAVRGNEYATAEQQQHAERQLALIKEKERLSQAATPETVAEVPTTQPAASPAGELDSGRATTLVQEGHEAIRSGDFDAAEKRFAEALLLVPNHADALAGRKLLEEYRGAEGRPSSLLDRYRVVRNLRWQMATRRFREREKEARELMLAHKYDEAHQALQIAGQTIEAARKDAEPADAYDAMKRELTQLEQWLATERVRFEEDQVAGQLWSAREEARKREQRIQQEKDRRIQQMMERVIQLKQEREYDAAIEQLKEILVIEPTHQRAADMKRDLDDVRLLFDAGKDRREFVRSSRRELQASEPAKIPIEDIIRYPSRSSWEVVVQRDPVSIGMEEEADEKTRATLETLIIDEVDFDGILFEEAILELETKSGLRLVPNWEVLELDGDVTRDKEVSVRLANVKLKTALELLLENAGGEVELAYDIKGGQIRVSTRTDLLRRSVEVRVYDVRDLLDDLGSQVYSQMGGMGGMGGGMMGGGMMGGGMMGGMGGGMMGGGMMGGGMMGGGMMGGMGGGMMGGMGGGMMGGGMGGGGYGGGGGGYGGGGGGGYGGGGGGYGGGGGGGYGGGSGTYSQSNDIAYQVSRLVRQTVAPGTWLSTDEEGDEDISLEEEEEGRVGSINPLNGLLIIRHTPMVHRSVGDLLDQLRSYPNLQVAIEARFLTIRRNYLEEIGIDLDVVLNQGNAGYDRAGVDPVTGVPLLMPRRFGQMGFGPNPVNAGTPFDQTALEQPYSNVALVPQPGTVGPASGQWTPVPILNNTLGLARSQSTGLPGSLGGRNTPALEAFGSFLDNIQVDFLLRATQADAHSSTVDAPRIVLSNNEDGEMFVGSQTWYVARLSPGQTQATAAVTATIVNQLLIPEPAPLQVGRTLVVRPIVSHDRKYVTLVLRPNWTDSDGIEFLTWGNRGEFIQLPRQRVTSITTKVRVPDGGTLLLGGLTQSGEVEIEAGVPVLSKIPILKRLYDNRSLTKDEFIMLILVKPRIIIQEEEEDKAFSGLAESAAAGSE